MAIDLQTVADVAKLARLDLSPAGLEAMRRQLSSILDYVDQLKQLDTTGVEPLAHPLKVYNVFRPDEPAPSLPSNGHRLLLPIDAMAAASEQAVVVPASVRHFLRDDLTGFGAAVAGFRAMSEGSR